jgi:hypothetical protein
LDYSNPQYFFGCFLSPRIINQGCTWMLHLLSNARGFGRSGLIGMGENGSSAAMAIKNPIYR